MHNAPRIGISSNIFHVDPARPVYKGKTLVYGDESLAKWLEHGGALPYLLPRLTGAMKMRDLVAGMDGIVLTGGADISPKSYGETPLKPEWGGDYERDQYEFELFHAALDAGKPVLGVCRGHQVINVALGGSMFQDIQTQNPSAQVHRSWEVYDELKHEIEIVPGSTLSTLYPGRKTGLINSIHHQAIKNLGKVLVAQAYSLPDRIIESVWLEKPGAYVMGVQWHPEWVRDPAILDSSAIVSHFLKAVREKRDTGSMTSSLRKIIGL